MYLILYQYGCLQKKGLSDLAHFWVHICPQNMVM